MESILFNFTVTVVNIEQNNQGLSTEYESVVDNLNTYLVVWCVRRRMRTMPPRSINNVCEYTFISAIAQ